MSYKIYGREESPMLKIVVNGYEVFGATLGGVVPESREWLAQHLSEAFEREIAAAVYRGIEQHKAEMRALLGIRESK